MRSSPGSRSSVVQLFAPRFRLVFHSTLCATLLSTSAIVHAREARGRLSEPPIASGTAEPDVRPLRDALRGLSPSVAPREAARVEARAQQTAADLKREYRVVGSPHFHNFLVNAGIRKRGLCHEWTRDLMAQLSALNLKTLDLHWGIARAGTLREHNAVVVTAKRQPFANGIVLDPWRYSGRLFVGRVAGDRYPWSEDLRDCLCDRGQGRKPATEGRGLASVPSRATHPTR